jgi:multiple sugar transport system substrate-binding protein
MSRGSRFRIAIRRFGPFESAIRKQWDRFCQTEQEAPELEAEAFDLPELYETLFEREGLRRGDWDVGFINTDWVAAARATGAVLDLADHLRSAPPHGYPGAWTPSLLRLQQCDGAVLGLPYHDGPECLIYRRDLLDPSRVPQTWEEFRDLARHFTQPGKGLYGTVFAAFPDGHNTVYDFCLQLWTRGGELFDGAGRVTLDTPQAVDALEFYRAMLNDPRAVHPGSRKFDSVQSGLAFAAGEVAMMVNWFGFAALCETGDYPVRGKVDIAGIPRAAGSSSVSLNVYWLLSIGSGSPHRDLAFRFLRHCADPAMDRLLTLEGGIGCRKSTWRDAEVNRAVPFYHKLESLHANARELPRLERWPELAKTIDMLVLEAIDGQRPVADLVRAAQLKARNLAVSQP